MKKTLFTSIMLLALTLLIACSSLLPSPLPSKNNTIDEIVTPTRTPKKVDRDESSRADIPIETAKPTPEIETQDTTTEFESNIDKPKPSIKPKPIKDKTNNEYINIISELDPIVVANKIKDYAIQEWEDDYSMQKYIIDEQTESYQNLLTVVIDSEVKNIIMKNAFDNWQYELDMVEYEYTYQLEAYNKMIKIKPSNDVQQRILDKALKDWAPDFEMVIYDYEQQLKDYAEINN
ncbi:MAG: hypothetical protein NAG76_11250 [Candidatus Pristimantibacillus lignocellulolyticus]|uniref:Lipoprotein n=1 Tax=Candidatus Pristimantibacillus lignocellulolyticus TaxID=2994561 RepID=A0A9J6Z8M8_9BACL|nr:MAG: hypothetical protein NAG76_11250 [Candidatus Pristimantibacillus lignocellulolyticus]